MGGSSEWLDICTAPCGREASLRHQAGLEICGSAEAGGVKRGEGFSEGPAEGLERSTEPDSCQKSPRYTSTHVQSQARTPRPQLENAEVHTALRQPQA